MTKTGSKKLKLNNGGSTLVMTLITIAFISLLASVILAAAVGNVVMKRIDYNSKDTFYTAESVVDEIKVGVGNDSMDAMAGAYEKVLANLIITDGTIDYMMSNDEANELLKKLFMKEIASNITNGNVNFDTITDKYEDNSALSLTNAKAYLEKFINKEDYENRYATVKSIESITFIKDYAGIQNEIILNNVVIDYKAEKATDTYFANVTVDLDIEYPNMIVDFSATKRLDDFKEFAFIADKDVKVNATTSDITANVNASIYAGEYISISSGIDGMGTLNVGAFTDSEGVTKSSNVVARKDLVITGSETDVANSILGNVAKLNLTTTNLWVNNIETGDQITTFNEDITAGVDITINTDCNSFVADDLNIKGKNSVINIGGNYYGYNYEGVNDAGNHALSSAIIVSGAGSVLNLGTDAVPLKKLVIGGHSYINYNNDAVINYMTGESLSFTSDQELYFVPSEYIGKNYGQALANPMPKTAWDELQLAASAEGSTVKLVDMTGFFAYDEGLLNSVSPYEVKTIGDNMVYIYLNFSDRASAAKYIQGIFAGKAPELQNKLDKYTSELLGEGVASSGSVNIADGVTMYTSGALMETNGSSVDLTFGGDISQAELGVDAMDYKNRYTIISQLLVPLPFEVDGSRYVVDNIDTTLEELKEYYITGSEMLPETKATDNIIDWDMVESRGYNDSANTKELAAHAYGMALTKVAIDGFYTIPDHIKGGIIVATGDVTVNHDFTGLIITQGNIIVSSNATVTTNDAMVEQLITFEYSYTDGSTAGDLPFKNYFHAYKSTGVEGSEEVKIESLKYDDMISLNNWRKYDDSAE